MRHPIRVIHCNDHAEYTNAFEEVVEDVDDLEIEHGLSVADYRVFAERWPVVDLVVTDLNFEDNAGTSHDGLDIMSDALSRWPECHVVVYSQQGEKLLRLRRVLDLIHQFGDRLDIYDVGSFDGDKQMEVLGKVVKTICRVIRLQRRERLAASREPLVYLSRGASHLLASQMNGVYLALEMMREGEIPDDMRSRIDQIVDQVGGVRRSVALLQEFSDDGKKGKPPAQVGQMLGILEGLQGGRLRDRHGIELEVKSEDDLVVEAAFFDLTMCLLHLLKNSEEAILAVREHEPDRAGKIFIGATRQGTAGARLVIQDNGEGMTDTILSRCMEPFFTTRGSNSHHGLGLTEAEARARRFEGALKISSKQGEGTTVELRVAVSPPARS